MIRKCAIHPTRDKHVEYTRNNTIPVASATSAATG